MSLPLQNLNNDQKKLKKNIFFMNPLEYLYAIS